ncbi:hypothetical protein [Shewanella salipaludis]|uniref:Uncharacterized protein n=1 Tax=Shewanella salipaludis TaxID=2723052 RepID=A0A972FSP5_9GAMM|nr:hypothetical protein [Shewanella salipaludis]NMH64992.1 hypothetical protein [Shewanella salipaludis]
MDTSYVPLKRTFSLVARDSVSEEKDNFEIFFGLAKHQDWPDLEVEYRVVILADAGAGKTFEMRAQAEYAVAHGRAAFFIRIEDLDDNFEDAFEIGTALQFEQWLGSSEEAWFFLDSVDEARLDNPRTFEKAMKLFSLRIRTASHRAHIYISSRPYAWRFKTDRTMIEQLFPYASQQTESIDESDENDLDPELEKDTSEGPLRTYLLRPLGLDAIRQFAEHRSTSNVDKLIADIERTNLMTIAARPFDLEGLLEKWKDDEKLGSRLESLQHNIGMRLDEIDPSRKQLQPLNQTKAREGARLLAAAVTLTGEAGILVPDKTHEKAGIDAEKVLSDWNPNDVKALLERGIFNDVIYGAVRFRHREIRELLTAEWLHSLIEEGNSRRAIESLIFKEQYGELVVTPRLRPILPWLILFDSHIRKRTLALHPEIAVEGGDVARLPIGERQKILNDIVMRIVGDEDDGSARDNAAIARIAQPDLSTDVQRLVAEYGHNDDAIFFLGRLIWQGSMAGCLEDLFPIASDSERGIYARIASVRAICTVGTDEQQVALWQAINNVPDLLPRKLLAELLQYASQNSQCVELLLASIDKLAPYERYSASGLSQALHAFIESSGEQQLVKLIAGFRSFLERSPYHEQAECRVSTAFLWLLIPASHAVEKLIAMRSTACFDDAAITILLKAPAVRYWRGESVDEYKNNLQDLIPSWPELNDALFWRSITEARADSMGKVDRLTVEWSVQYLGHYFAFHVDSFWRVLKFVSIRPLEDDKLVALSLACRIYKQSDKPEEWLDALQTAVSGNNSLEEKFEQLLLPPISETDQDWQKEQARYERQQEEQRQKKANDKTMWIGALRVNPDRVRNPPGLEPGQISNDQSWLLMEIEDSSQRMSRGKGANWRALIGDFGKEVALAFRDAAMTHWRVFKPVLRSEGDDTRSFTYALIFAVVGLEIEALEIKNFPNNLTQAEVTQALRYIVWELNGFPSWLETMHRAYPQQVLAAIWQELTWELESSQPEQSNNYILHALVYYAPWLHGQLVEPILQWVGGNALSDNQCLNYCLHILINGGVTNESLVLLAKSKTALSQVAENQLPTWYALWVDTEPETGIPSVKTWLESMALQDATQAAQLFIVALLGGRRDDGKGAFVGEFRTASHLKELYLLMHNYIKAQDDIERAGSPGLRDDAQDARNRLFNMLAEIPGKDSYIALSELAQNHPVEHYRSWMKKRAYKRAEEDADLEPWSSQQVRDFGASLEMTPASHRQLFDIGVLRLNDFKVWLELGNDSLAETYQRAADETEMRKIVAHWLNQKAHGRYTCAEEANLANDQRPDIWFQHPNIKSPVPIELKLLDKGWSGPKLCERLRNQLAGDYLREENAGCGIFLLVWQGSESDKNWEIEGKRINVSKLQKALEEYWLGISGQFPNVSAIEIIVIDLTLRALRSET